MSKPAQVGVFVARPRLTTVREHVLIFGNRAAEIRRRWKAAIRAIFLADGRWPVTARSRLSPPLVTLRRHRFRGPAPAPRLRVAAAAPAASPPAIGGCGPAPAPGAPATPAPGVGVPAAPLRAPMPLPAPIIMLAFWPAPFACGASGGITPRSSARSRFAAARRALFSLRSSGVNGD